MALTAVEMNDPMTPERPALLRTLSVLSFVGVITCHALVTVGWYSFLIVLALLLLVVVIITIISFPAPYSSLPLPPSHPP